MLTRWNSQNSLIKLSYERVVSCRFPERSVLPAVSGTTLTRRYYPKKKNDQETEPEPVAAEDLLPWELDAEQELELVGKKMSSRTAQKIRQKITAMYECGLAKTFVTLTFVNKVTDPVAVRCLAKLLKLWRDQWGKFSFLWVAERQNENKKYPGNIHFHLILDREVDIKKENARWVRLQYNSGIVYHVDKAGMSFILDPINMSNQVISQYVNPFDIVRIRSSQNLKSYLAGYVTKSIGDVFHSRVWHCSRLVSQLATEVLTNADVHRDLLVQIPGEKNTYVYKKDIVNKSGKVLKKAGTIVFPIDNSNEYCSWVYIVNVEYCKRFTDQITQINKWIVAGEFQEGKRDFLYYDYESYAKEFFSIEDFGYKLYKKIAHNWQSLDASNDSHIDRRGLDFENDFYQYSKARKSRGYFAVYSQQPYINRLGQRFYNGKLFEANKFITEFKKYDYDNRNFTENVN